MSIKKFNTLLEILNYSAGYLNDNKIENSRLNAELMLADVLNCKRLQLYLDFEKPLTMAEKEKFKDYLRRRVKREPLQYILGIANFFGYEISINNKVLIPRQDTEILVEKILADIYSSGIRNLRIFEVGVGSGCIAVAILSELKKKDIICKYEGIDISEDSLQVAKKNLKFYELENYDIKAQDFLKEEFEISDNYDYVISNPPYVSIDEFVKLEPEVNKFEPDFAVTDFEDGMRFYRKLLKSFKKNNAKYYLEIGYNSKEKLEEILKGEGISNYSFEKDYNDNYRILKVNK